jgi:hypothetical protein
MGLREVLSALGKGDPTGAKTAAAKVGQAAKALDELHRHVATTYRKAEELFRKQEPLRKEITFCDHEMFGRDDSAADRAMTDAKGLVVVGMKRSAEALAEYAAEGKKVLAEALKALKGGAEAEAVYLGGVQRLAQRVFEGTTRLKRTAEIIAGEVDQVNFARMNGDEAQEPKEKQRLYDAARSKIEPQRKACREIAKELSRAKTEIQRELESFPQSALGNPKLKGFLDDIAAGQGLLQEISQDIEEQVIRLEQLEGKLR